MQYSLSGKTAVICGSTQGIGLAIAREMAAAGASCILLARNAAAMKEIITQLPVIDSTPHRFEVADFSDSSSVADAIQRIVSTSTVHILVNNTGGPSPGPVSKASSEQFIKAFNQHLINNQYLAQAVIPGMKEAGYGRIINIISTSVKIPLPNLGVSNTIRAAVASWSKTLSNEVGEFNITVNAVLPGLTETERLSGLIGSIAESRQVDKTVIEKEMRESIPMKRFGEAREIARVVCFLASPAASYINGVSLPVDGGRTGTLS